MQKAKTYKGTICDVEAIKESLSLWSEHFGDQTFRSLSIDKGNESWEQKHGVRLNYWRAQRRVAHSNG